MEDKKFLKTGEVAKLLGVPKRTINSWAENGILVPVQKTKAGYNLYTHQQIEELCQSAINFLASSENRAKSPTIKNRTAQNLQRVGTPEKNYDSIRIIPAKKLVMPNDKLTKRLFNHTPEEYLTLFEEGGEIVEVKNFPKIGEVITPYWLELIEEYTDKTPLTMFARVILTACVSEWVIGNRYTTIGIIFRHIIGKARGSNAQPTKKMKELILYCIRKMMCTVLRVDMTDVCKHLNYNNGEPLIFNAPILPCKYVEGVTINGNKSETVIYFFDESPLLTVARIKNNQLLSVEPKLLNISKRIRSTRCISVRHYIIQRVMEIILHKMLPVITFEDIYQKCGLVDATAKTKYETIHEVIEIFDSLKTCGDIKDFTVNKSGEEYVSIEISIHKQNLLSADQSIKCQLEINGVLTPTNF